MGCGFDYFGGGASGMGGRGFAAAWRLREANSCDDADSPTNATVPPGSRRVRDSCLYDAQ